MVMIIAQISDLHVHAEGNNAYGVVNTIPLVQQAIAHLNQLDPRPDVVVATGDLTHRGQVEEYEMLRSLLSRLEIPLYLLLGNHDNHQAFYQVFKDCDYLPFDHQYVQYVVDHHPVRLIMLDTVVPGYDGGELNEYRLTWLAQQLSREPKTPTILFMHHPPFKTNIPTMDCIGLTGRQDLADLVAQYPTIERIAAGHLHRAIVTRWAGTVASTTPSLVHQVMLNLRPDLPGSFVMEPPAYQLHLWNESELVSHTVYVGRYPGPYRFSDGALL